MKYNLIFNFVIYYCKINLNLNLNSKNNNICSLFINLVNNNEFTISFSFKSIEIL